jgi:hypothetical protein
MFARMTVEDRISHKHTIQYTQDMQNIQHKYHKDFIQSIMVILKYKNIQLRRKRSVYLSIFLLILQIVPSHC